MKFAVFIMGLMGAFFAVVVIGASAQSTPGDAHDSHSFWHYVDKSGDITRPSDKLVRRDWVHLGSWAIPKVKGARGPGMHDVYTERWVLKSFNKNHEWPDGAVLVKQIHAINKGSRTTGPEVYWEGGTGAWFVMVKDRQNRFPDDARWGKGWGWALFKADHPDTNVNKNWKKGNLSNCFGCHVPAKNTDWTYLEGYSVLDLTDQQKQRIAEH